MTAGSSNHTPRPARFNTVRRARHAFTIVETIVVIGIIAVVAALVLTAMRGVRETSDMTQSMNNLRQISTWMRTYATENREYIVPSQFDYTGNTTFPGHVRTGDLGYTVVGDWEENQGTWTDILWVHSGLTTPSLEDGSAPYRYDSPDYGFLPNNPDFVSPFWSYANNTFNTPGAVNGDLPKPFGTGGFDVGRPGWFAANNFFDSTDPAIGHLTMGQIKAPGRSVYLVDSVAGEIIEDEPDAWNIIPDGGDDLREVDFRYNDVCLMMMLDGSVKTMGQSWDTLDDLEESGIRVRNLTSR